MVVGPLSVAPPLIRWASLRMCEGANDDDCGGVLSLSKVRYVAPSYDQLFDRETKDSASLTVLPSNSLSSSDN